MPGIARFIASVTSSPKKIFLVDSTGALMAVLFLGIVLVRFEAWIGMPRCILYLLSLIAGLYAVYSACCYFFLTGNRRPYLKALITGNTLYGVFTLGLVIYYYHRLTVPGVLYFLLDLAVVAAMVTLQVKTLNNTR